MTRLTPTLAGLLLVTVARPALADTLMPRIVHEACAEFEKGKTFHILARFEDESQLFDPKVIFRTSKDSHWKQASFAKVPGTETFRAVLKARDLRGALDYFIEVFDEFGNGPARIGSPEAPIRVVPARSPAACEQIPSAVTARGITSGSKPPDPLGAGGPPPAKDTCDLENRPLYCEAWLWATIGVVAAGGIATTVILAASGGDEPLPSIDSVTLAITGPSPVGGP